MQRSARPRGLDLHQAALTLRDTPLQGARTLQAGLQRRIQTLREGLQDGLARLRHPRRPVRRPVICMYHSISPAATEDDGPWAYALTPETFETQIAWLARNRTPIPMADLADYLRGTGPIPADAVVLTFDDGYQDFQEWALPILRAYDVPSTVYVSTDLLERGVTPYEFRLTAALHARDELTVERGDRQRTYDLSCERQAAYDDLRTTLKTDTVSQRERVLARFDVPDPSDPAMLSPGTIETLARDPLVTVGAHGHEHVPLDSLNPAAIEDNVRTSRSRLADILDEPPVHFSYPYGSAPPSARQHVRAAGFQTAVTTTARPIAPRDWSLPYALPRIDMADPERRTGDPL